MTTRVNPVCPPYPPDVAARLEAMMPPGVPPIVLFRTFVRNLPMTAAMSGWGSYELSKRLSLSMRDRRRSRSAFSELRAKPMNPLTMW